MGIEQLSHAAFPEDYLSAVPVSGKSSRCVGEADLRNPVVERAVARPAFFIYNQRIVGQGVRALAGEGVGPETIAGSAVAQWDASGFGA
jgi:hypothetical protein